MKRFLPHVVRQAQLLTRNNVELKAYLFDSLKRISDFPSEDEKLKWIQEEVDQLINEEVSSSQCQKGCSYCCYHPISLSQEESKYISSLKPEVHQERLKKQRDHFKNSTPISYEDRACVYLEGGHCSVYERRPLICRLTHVSSIPSNCHLENSTLPIQHLPLTKAALLVGAYYMGHPHVDLLPLLVSQP